MSYHVVVRLPDGREAAADYRQPIVHVMRRILKQRGQMKDGAPEDYALVAEWLDACPEQACDMAALARESIAAAHESRLCDQTCGGRHPPATREPCDPPKYRRPALGGLW